MTGWLHQQRLGAVYDAIRASGATTVLDLGCGDGALLRELADDPQISHITGVDISRAALARLHDHLNSIDRIDGVKVELLEDTMLAPQTDLTGFDCAILIETVEHVPPELLSKLEHSIFKTMRPRTTIVTTPNAEFNALLGVPAGRFRHRDHRFEWDRARFRQWAEGVSLRQGYRVECVDIAGGHADHGGASQMAVFKLQGVCDFGNRASD